MKVAEPPSDISNVRAVIAEPPSLPKKCISASEIRDCITKLSLSSLNCAYIDEPSNNLTSPLSSALRSILPPTSIVKSELPACEIVVPSIVILSTTTPAFAVTVPLKLALPASDISSVRAVIPEPPSLPLKSKSLSCTFASIEKLELEFSNTPISAEPSSKAICPPSAFSFIFPATSSVKLPLDKSISVPSIVMLSATNDPPVIAPVVVIVLEPLLIVPKPLVIDPESNAPVVTILELPAAAEAPISDKTSLADLPSMAVPFTLKKSSSATPLVNLGTLLFDMPVSKVAVVVIAVLFKVIASASNVPSTSTSPEISKLVNTDVPTAVMIPGKVTLLLASSKTALLAGKVQNTSLVPALKSTALSLLELDKIVVRESVSGVASVTVPIPTSNSAPAVIQ